MVADNSDPFLAFATKHGLRIVTDDLCIIPRDVLASPAESDRHTLVTLIGRHAAVEPLRVLFVGEGCDVRPPSIRDVLWWLSSDSWALDQADRDCSAWAREYSYPDEDPATLRLFRVHSRNAQQLKHLLGQPAYDELLQLYA